VLVAFALVSALAAAAGADTQGKLTDAESQLHQLETQISAQQKNAEDLRVRLTKLQEKVDVARRAFDSIGVQLIGVRGQYDQAQAQYLDLQSRLDALARNAYMSGPGAGLEVVLGARSMTDLNERIQFLAAATEQDSILATQVGGVATSLGQRKSHLQTLLSRRAVLLGELGSVQDSLTATLADQEQALSDLGSTRDEIVNVISHLSVRLQKQALAQAGHSLQGNNNAPYGAWAALFLQHISAPTCYDNLVVMVAWQVQEGTRAAWNPLATTQPMPGASQYNSVGVRNYVSLAQGLEATRITLDPHSYGYGDILKSLHACGTAMATARAVNASYWCRGCTGGNYLTGLVPKVQANYEVYSKL
jgi:peptidoglycan hydrolase CwlO-like protein